MSEAVPSAARYYPVIRAAARATGLDWWLLYCVIAQESDFNPQAESGCGALGLMQLMPRSFPASGRNELLDPEMNVRLGAQHLRDCIAIWKAEPPDEAVQFGLASYNGGAGYVLAAQARAAALHQDAHAWATVGPLLNDITWGGKRPDAEQIQDYVRRIWSRYLDCRQKAIPAGGDTDAADV